MHAIANVYVYRYILSRAQRAIELVGNGRRRAQSGGSPKVVLAADEVVELSVDVDNASL